MICYDVLVAVQFMFVNMHRTRVGQEIWLDDMCLLLQLKHRYWLELPYFLSYKTYYF